MDHGLQSFVSEDYLPKVMERIRILGGSGQGKSFIQNLI
jgi:hypothetical protein